MKQMIDFNRVEREREKKIKTIEEKRKKYKRLHTILLLLD